MQKMRVRIGALFMALCVALTFVLNAGAAYASESYNFALTVQLVDGLPADVLADVEKDLVVDVYKMADAIYEEDTDTYGYANWADGFVALADRFEMLAANRDSKASDWQALYADAAAIVANAGGKITPVIKGAKLGTVSLDAKGLYLVITHGTVPSGESEIDAKKDYAGVANGAKYKAFFLPTMVAAPTKWADESGDMAGVIYTDASSGSWKDSATVLVKLSYEEIPTEKVTPPPSKRVVPTGDDNHLGPLYAVMAVSGALFVGLAVSGALQKRKEN